MTTVICAHQLIPGDSYHTADGEEKVVKHVRILSHRVTVIHTDGTERTLFPQTRCDVTA